MPRTNISVSDEVADMLSTEALRRRKTLYAFANESLEAVLSVCRLSGEPEEVPPSWKMGKMLKDLDAVPLPGDLLERLIRKLYSTDKDWLLRTWEAAGSRVGRYLQLSYQSIGQLSEAAIEFQGFLPLKRIELRSIESEGTSPVMSLRGIGLGLSEESTECAERFIHGIVQSYNWNVRSSHVSEGIIDLRIAQARQ